MELEQQKVDNWWNTDSDLLFDIKGSLKIF